MWFIYLHLLNELDIYALKNTYIYIHITQIRVLYLGLGKYLVPIYLFGIHQTFSKHEQDSSR